MSIGAKLVELRLRSGKSLQEVADAIGVSKTHVWALEKGKSDNPSLDLVRKLADYFSVTVDFLVVADSSASVEEAEAHQFFRDFTSLSLEDQELLKQTLARLKTRPKSPTDDST
jgi:transcriptional regulator with XRE-family HTH domain